MAKSSDATAPPAAASTPVAAKNPPASTSNHNTAASNTAAGEYLLERLRVLLARLQTASEILQTWPETQGDSAKVHADTAAKLIAAIRRVALGARGVERHVNGTGPAAHNAAEKGESGGSNPQQHMSTEALTAFRSSLEEKCPVPLDLLDLLDVGQPFGMHPQCYSRQLLREARRRLAGLERRKRALDMLAASIEEGMDGRGAGDAGGECEGESETEGGEGSPNTSKRKREETAGEEPDVAAKKLARKK